MGNNIYAALEIGTTRTVFAIGETDRASGRLKVVCHAEIPSTGVRKSKILDINQATQSIRSVFHEIEKRQSEAGSKLMLYSALLVVSGQDIRADSSFGMVQVEGSKVGTDEINEVAASSRRQMALPKDRELLDVVDQDYVLDNMGGISSPRGMTGRVLKLNTLHVHADRNRIQDARTAAHEAHIEVEEPVFAATCAADAVLEEHEKRNGVLVLDLGGGSTGYAVYVDGYLVSTGAFGIGGDHITNDIANAFSTTNAQAEELKLAEAAASFAGESAASARVKIPGSTPLMETKTVSRHALNTVVNARLKELFSMVREQLEEEDLLHRLHAGVVMTGGGSALRDIEVILEQELGMSVRKGRPIHLDGLEKVTNSEAFSAIAGALMYAQHNDDRSSILDGLFGRFFK